MARNVQIEIVNKAKTIRPAALPSTLNSAQAGGYVVSVSAWLAGGHIDFFALIGTRRRKTQGCPNNAIAQIDHCARARSDTTRNIGKIVNTVEGGTAGASNQTLTT